MNLPFGIPALAAWNRLKAGLQTSRLALHSVSWGPVSP